MNAMGLFESSELRCSSGQNCSDWAKTNFNYCLCGTKDVVSLILGLISVLSWGVAEVPQIITNFREKSTEGISILFLMTWIIGDFLNLIGCKLEPATLPTQYYTAILYTMTTLILASQTIYYNHIYPKLKSNRRPHKNDMVETNRWHINDIDRKPIDGGDLYGNRNSTLPSGVAPSMPIPLLAHSRFNEGELYYTSARSLSRSHTPPVGFHMQRRMSSLYEQSSIEEPLIGGHLPNLSVSPSNTKTMLCVVSGLILFLNLSNLQLAKGRSVVYGKENGGTVVLVGRKLLQATECFFRETGNTESAKVGSFFGWGMAAIYLCGRLPQILLNFRRGNAQGLNPLMFVFALVGNITYVASILVSSLEWSKIRPNLPWLVDAGGCVALDSVILIQFIYFRYHPPQDLEINNGISNIT